MEAKEFNALLKLLKTDAEATYKFSMYCVSRIKSRLRHKKVKEQDLEDISHNIFMQIYNKPPEFVYAPYKFLCKVTDNYLVNLGKKQTRENEIMTKIALDSQEIENIPYEFTLKEAGNKILENVSETDEEIITMHVVEGYSHRDISNMLDIGYDAVRARYSRAMKKLRQKLKSSHNKKF